MKNKHGGRRDGAGHPLKGKEKRAKILISIDPNVLKQMDKKRGELSRGDYIAKLQEGKP
jgi:hypothetical protein